MEWWQCQPRSTEGQQKGHELAKADVHYAAMITVATAAWNRKLHLHENGCHKQFGIKSECKHRPVNMFKMQSANITIVCMMMTILLCSFTKKTAQKLGSQCTRLPTQLGLGTFDACTLTPNFSKRLFLQNKPVTSDSATTEKAASGAQKYRQE